MPRRNDKEKPLGIKGLLGLGLDSADEHTRISRGPNFVLLGGSEQTHEKMQQIALRFNERVDERGKRLEDINGRELEEITEEIAEDE